MYRISEKNIIEKFTWNTLIEDNRNAPFKCDLSNMWLWPTYDFALLSIVQDIDPNKYMPSHFSSITQSDRIMSCHAAFSFFSQTPVFSDNPRFFFY